MKSAGAGWAAVLFASTAFAAVDVQPHSPATPRLARPGIFAAASAPFAKRMTPEQREEWNFLKDAAAASRFGSDAAHLALAKSGDAQVRSLAAALVNHHAATQPALQRMLHARNMAPPMLSNEQRHALNRLAKLQGAKFDREWLEWVALRSQQDSLASYEKASATARDASVRAWVTRTVPAMRYQLASAQRVVSGGTKFANLSPYLPSSAIKSHAPATAVMGAAPAANPADLGEGNMVLGPARPVAAKFSEPGSP